MAWFNFRRMMKTTLFKRILPFILLLTVSGLVWQSCSKPSGPTPVTTNDHTITGVVHASSTMTVLSQALTVSGLDTILSQPGPYTFFGLTDNVLAASGITQATLESYPDSVIRNLILYHTLAGEAIYSANFPPGPNFPIIMANGDSVFTTTNGYGFFLNGFPVTTTDVSASNGLINLIAHVLFPPKGSILQTLQADSSYSLLAAAIARASQGSSNLDSILAGSGPFTVFAPVNTAFNAAGYGSVTDINNANPDSLANVISYHILSRRYFTSDMVVGDTPVALNDSSFTVIGPANNSWQIQGKGNTSASNILTQNILARNGVLHSVDQLMIP
jgi:uncharacterized surface protein with fasciclin (FAS1) repeats